MQTLDTKAVHQLYKAISLLQTEEECRAFLEDLCTIKEVLDMSQRLEAAQKLAQGDNYLDIAKNIGISTATISRVSRSLKYGSGGYEIILDRLTQEEAQEEEQE
ncbi:MAG: TrpR YerC/YecD [Lachnospiraceae bacterium]|nr:TrpR YerC/YecD [Lachnospiraceae bacterium]